MDKRLPIALLLSIAVFVAWEYFFVPKPPPKRPEPQVAREAPRSEAAGALQVPAAPAAPGAVAPESGEPVLGTPLSESEERLLELRVGTPGKRGSYYAQFSNRGARLVDLRLGDSFDRPKLGLAERADIAHWTRLVRGVSVEAGTSGSLAWRATGLSTAYERGALDRALWTMTPLGPAEAPTGVRFELQPGAGVRFQKTVRFRPDSYDLEVELALVNEAASSVGPATFVFTPAEVVPLESGDTMYVEPQAVAAARESAREKLQFAFEQRDDSGSDPSGDFGLPDGKLSFAGVCNKYFAVLARGDSKSAPTVRNASWRRVRDADWAALSPANAAKPWRFLATDIRLQLEVPPVGTSAAWTYLVYAGPKNPDTLAAAHGDFSALLAHDLGFFTSIAHFLLAVLNFFHGVVGNWGVAIILLTLSVRLVLFPLNRRSQTAMARYQAKMKRIQPLIEALKKRYEKDPAKLRQEQTLLMQKEGAFPPLGGCLPMFLQIPVFFGLFSALRASFDLRHAPFALWIHDLARPDELWEINLQLPLIGTIHYFNLLPILMVVLWVLQQRLMPKPTEEQALKMHRMMMIMPVFMGFFLYGYAAGLSLYMITQSTLGIVEQVVIKRFWPLDATELPPKQGGFFAKLAKLQEEQSKKLAAGGATKKKRA